MRTYEVTVSKSVTLQVKQFEPETIFIAAKIVTDEDNVDRKVLAEQLLVEINEVGYAEKERILNNKKVCEINEFDFYDKDGNLGKYDSKKFIYPRCSDIVSVGEKPYDHSPAYGVRGTAIHRVFAYWIRNGEYKWDITKDELETCKDIGLDSQTWGLHWILEQNLDFSDAEVFVRNDDKSIGIYAGRLDAYGAGNLYDLKTGDMSKPAYRDKAFTQMAGYDLARPNLEIEGYTIIAAKEKKTYITEDLEKYRTIFKKKRAEFKERYGV